MAKLSTKHRELTPEDVKSAFYIDFEGLGRKKGGSSPEPSFLGIYCQELKSDDRYVAAMIDPELKLLTRGASGFPGKREFVPDLDQVISNLLDRAQEEDRKVLYYSQHEQAMVEEHCSPEVARLFACKALNVKGLCERWARSRPNQIPDEKSLNDYLRLAGINCPEAPGSGLANSIRKLRTACGSVRKWGRLPEEDKQLAIDLFNYNRDDCRTLFRLTKKSVNALGLWRDTERRA